MRLRGWPITVSRLCSQCEARQAGAGWESASELHNNARSNEPSETRKREDEDKTRMGQAPACSLLPTNICPLAPSPSPSPEPSSSRLLFLLLLQHLHLHRDSPHRHQSIDTALPHRTAPQQKRFVPTRVPAGPLFAWPSTCRRPENLTCFLWRSRFHRTVNPSSHPPTHPSPCSAPPSSLP